MKRTIHSSPKQAGGRIPRELKPRLMVEYQNHIDGPDDEEAAGDDDCWPAQDDEEGDPFPPDNGRNERVGRVGSWKNPTPEQKAALLARLERTHVEMTAKRKAREEEQAKQKKKQQARDVRNVRPPESMARPTPGQTTLPTPPPAAPKKARPPLPPALQPGGLADQVLERVRQACSNHHDLIVGSPTTIYLRAAIEKDIGKMRSHRLWREAGADGGVGSARRAYRQILRQPAKGSRALFRFCLAAREGLREEEDRRLRALTRYMLHPRAYDLAFGDLIPAEFREHAKKAAARQAYTDNTNATAASDWAVFTERLTAQRRQPMLGIPTGLKSLDEALGGLRGATLLAGDTGVGKSLLALDLAVRVIRTNPRVAVLLYTLELPKDDVYTRLLSREAAVPYRATAGKPSREEQKRLSAAEKRITEDILPRLRLAEYTRVDAPQRLSYAVVVKHAQKLLDSSEATRVCIIFDYLQKLELAVPAWQPSEQRDEPYRPTPEELDDERLKLVLAVQRWTRTAANPAGDPVLAVTEVRKPEHGRRRLELRDVRGSHHLVYAAGCVLFLEPQDSPAPAGDVVPVWLNVAKIGSGGRRGDVPLDFHHTVSRFEEPATNAPPPHAAPPASDDPPPKQAKRYAGK